MRFDRMTDRRLHNERYGQGAQLFATEFFAHFALISWLVSGTQTLSMSYFQRFFRVEHVLLKIIHFLNTI